MIPFSDSIYKLTLVARSTSYSTKLTPQTKDMFTMNNL